MTHELIVLCVAAFAAGFIDSIVGGGGLVQTPATLFTLPQYPTANLLATIKIPSFFGTSIAALQYARKVVLRWKLLAPMCLIAMAAACLGSYTVTVVSNQYLKPIIFVILIAVAIYTYTQKDFGKGVQKHAARPNEFVYAMLFALLIGFYDGFIGPGAGSFLIVFFIAVSGADFLGASAHAKLVNMSTNIGSLIFFISSGHILYQYAFPMAACNFTGSLIGARLAILKGNRFIRIFFLIVIMATILRFGYDIFMQYFSK